jgi:CDP-glycerol glycerophosphotransferase (TagB/SpsB family)
MKKISRVFKTLRILIFGWGIIVPLSYLFPLKKNLVLFIGKSRGLFFDNVKYLYLYLHRLQRNDIKYYFLTEKKTVYNMLKQHNLPVLLHPTLRSIYALICSNVVILCCMWNKRISFRAKKIQLWHGIGFKILRYRTKPDAPVIAKLEAAIRGRDPIYDLFVSTSDFYTQNVFSKTMRVRNFIESGYPRNDIFFEQHPDEYDLLGADKAAFATIKELRGSGYKIILYAPTFRETSRDAITDGALKLNVLSECAKKNKMLFVFKFHPSVRCSKELGLPDNIICYDSSKDIQPLLKATDILVTDYSSVYMDYLLLDRPIIFFPYDYEQYNRESKNIQFDYNSMTPGPVCYSQDQLQEAIINYTLSRKDDFAKKREEIKKLAFKYEDGRASERIWNFITKEYIEPSQRRIV